MRDKLKLFLKYKVLHIDDSPHRIAMGVALGLFVAWTPFFGLHLFLVLALAFLLRVNKFVAFTFVWTCNPFTLIPIYYPNYFLGRAILASVRTEPQITNEQVTAVFGDLSSISYIVKNFCTISFWQQVGSFFVHVGLEMFIGGLILGLVAALAGYFATSTLVTWYRIHHPHHRFKRHN